MTTDETPAAISQVFRLEDQLLAARAEVERLRAELDVRSKALEAVTADIVRLREEKTHA